MGCFEYIIMSFDIELVTMIELPDSIITPPLPLHIHKCRCKKYPLHIYCSNTCISERLVCPISHSWSHQANTLFLSDNYYHSINSISKDAEQIQLDVSRTMTDNKYYSSPSGSIILSRLLNRLSNLIPQTGYIQGMNFIASALLWHSSESQAFWLFYKLIKAYGLQENFSEGFPGVLNHFSNIENYIKELLPDMHTFLGQFEICVQLFATDWVICLFCKVIPLKHISLFFSGFLVDGWKYFYLVVVELLRVLRKDMMRETEKFKIFSILKSVQRGGERYLTGLDGVDKRIVVIKWKKLLGNARKRG